MCDENKETHDEWNFRKKQQRGEQLIELHAEEQTKDDEIQLFHIKFKVSLKLML